jgi:phage N-6-adenine-methyltransferase
MSTAVERKSGQQQLKLYDPEKGLKTIAVTEAAERYYRRARDIAGLIDAIEKKIEAQLDFVRWWNKQEKGQGQRSDLKQHRNRPVTKLIAGRDGMPARMVIQRWRRLLDDVKRLHVLEQAKESARRSCELDKTVRGTEGTGENEWFTPAEYVELARNVLGSIDLDPASSDRAQHVVQAAKYFTKADDGLSHEWRGRVWLNPPYAQPLIADFTGKMVAERRAGRVTAAIMLTHNYTDTAWFQHAAAACDALCFTRGRVKFYEPDGEIAAPTQGQAFLYFGDEVERFASVFAKTGFVALPWRK